MTPRRLKIFVSAYACEPNQGSELGVGWNWVLQMSRFFDLWVLTRESNRASIELWLSENKLEHTPHFVYYDLEKKWRWWKKGLRGVRLYYMLWQVFSNRLVRQTMQAQGIKIYNHLTYGNALWAVSSYGKRQTFIWGPTSLGNSVPKQYSRHYGLKGRIKEGLQRLVGRTARWNYGFNRRCRNAQLILCKTEQTLMYLPERYRSKAVVFTDVAVSGTRIESAVPRAESHSTCTRFLAVGRLEPWRGFDLLIEAFAQVGKQRAELHLDILGEGEDRARLEALIAKYGINQSVSLKGKVSMDEYYNFMAQSDVVVNPALREGAVTTAFDSMAMAKPLICIDTGGYTRSFSTEYAQIINLHKDRTHTIDEMARSLELLTDQALRARISERLVEVREGFSWENKGKAIRDIIINRLDL